jgi:hypothetical protein
MSFGGSRPLGSDRDVSRLLPVTCERVNISKQSSPVLTGMTDL